MSSAIFISFIQHQQNATILKFTRHGKLNFKHLITHI